MHHCPLPKILWGSTGPNSLFFYPFFSENTFQCQETRALGIENGGIADQQISASSQWSAQHAPSNGRLHFKQTASERGGWSALTNDVNQWLQIDLGNCHTRVTRVATQGRNSALHGVKQWVTKYRLQISDDGVTFFYFTDQGKPKVLLFYSKLPHITTSTFLGCQKLNCCYSFNVWFKYRPLSFYRSSAIWYPTDNRNFGMTSSCNRAYVRTWRMTM